MVWHIILFYLMMAVYYVWGQKISLFFMVWYYMMAILYSGYMWPKFPDVYLTVEVKTLENPQPGKWPNEDRTRAHWLRENGIIGALTLLYTINLKNDRHSVVFQAIPTLFTTYCVHAGQWLTKHNLKIYFAWSHDLFITKTPET